MKHILMIFFIAGLSALGCSSSPEKNDGGWDIVLSGKVGFPSSGQITIQRMQPDGLGWKDTIVLKSNFSYAKKIRLTEPGYYQLNFYDRQRLNLILAKTSIEINVDGNNPNGFAEIKGSPDHDLITKVQTLAGEAQNTPEIAALTNEFNNAVAAKDELKIQQLQTKYQELVGLGYDKIAALIREQPLSLGAINVLQSNNVLDPDKYITLFVETADRVKKEWPTSTYGKEFVSYVEKMKTTAIGHAVPVAQQALPQALPIVDAILNRDRAPAGYALRQIDTVPTALRIGELIALRIEGRSGLQVAMVRWFRNTLKGSGLEFGCELLSDNPQAAAELRARASELHRMLEQAGFNLSGGLSFDLTGDRGQQQRQAWQDQTENNGHTIRGQAFRDALDTAGDAADAAVQGALRLRRGVSPGLDLRI